MNQAAQETKTPSVAINGQYIKDLSFENPNAPMSLTPPKSAPNIEVNLNLEAKAIQTNVYEITLQITTKAKTAETNMFVVELSYAGLFTLTNIPEDQKEMVLLIHCPTILFPFARRVLSDATRDGGFQPLMLDPIDFAALYNQRKNDESTKSGLDKNNIN
ncbi:MAG: protein-export chaperone SecB [Pseudomonadota bacterium]